MLVICLEVKTSAIKLGEENETMCGNLAQAIQQRETKSLNDTSQIKQTRPSKIPLK